ncbi:CRAL/TRIO domain-containing protein [Plectosphaerella cucumerina]|uniref:CRAL/TRIO domain-containing protein n=1 Tax=Plectosphaerella cucumerina TaxID=40658 RepID=A0A8K0T511_9PEZI|nr:CRAL/TRIO domain-containing protein [Plectosphaerella cucumerina]
MATDAADTTQPLEQVQSTASAPSQANYPHGHIGHLSPSQEERFVEFKKLIEDRGLYTPGPPASHDDPLLLRYLRARRWVPADALVQFADTETWRKTTDIDTLYQTIAHPAYDAARRLYPQWTGRRDRRGIPLYLFEVKTLDSKAVADYEKQGRDGSFSDAEWDGKTPQGLLRLFALYENLTRFAFPLCSQLQDREHPGTPITMCNNIVDISGVSLRQFWNLKSHMQSASQLATAHYPETLDRIFIIGAPVFFSTVWGWIKRWFDPITVSKIFILSDAEVKPTLETFIDPRNIPKRYGGELDFSFGDLPVRDPAWDGIVEWHDGHKAFTTGPAVWRPSADGKRLECFGLGAVDGKKRNERICSVPITWPAPAAAPTDAVTEGVQNLSVADSAPAPAAAAPETTAVDEKKEAVAAANGSATATTA